MARRTSWADLPVDCRKNVLLRISWCDVCRLRAVCKQWNSDLEDPVFRPDSRCLLTAPRGLVPPQGISATGANPEVICIGTGRWQFLEIATNKVFYANDTFITKALRLRGIRHTMAASGGLIYAVYDDATHIVCNLMQNEYHQIPAPPYIHPRCPHTSADMVVVAGTQHYKIVHTGCFHGSSYCSQPTTCNVGLLEVSVYNSVEKAWRCISCSSISASCIPYRSLILDGVLHVVLEIVFSQQLLFKSLDLNTDVSSVTGIRLPQVPLCQSIKLRSTQVVATSGRLFFVEYSRRSPAAKTITVTIWKIALGDETVTEISHLPKFTKYVADSPQYPKALDAPVVAVGCGDSIVVSSFCGRRCRWDVLYDSWHEMERFSPVEPLTACHSFLVAPFQITRRDSQG